MADAAVTSDNLRLELVADGGSVDRTESPLVLLRRGLRGRYRRAVILASILGAIGAVLGFFAVGPKYVSTGLVTIDGALPAILYPTAENQVPPMFEGFVGAQVAMLQSDQLLEATVERPEMKAAGWASGPKGVAALRRALDVRRQRGEQVIYVSVSHRDPDPARLAVNTLLAEYQHSDPDPIGMSLAAKERALVGREARLEQDLAELRQLILEGSDQYGPEAVLRIHQTKVDELMAIDRKLDQIRLSRQQIESGADDGMITSDVVHGPPPATYLEEREHALIAEIESSRYAPDHPVMRELRRRLKRIRIQIALGKKEDALPEVAAGRDVRQTALDQLAELEAHYTAARRRVSREASQFGDMKIVLAGLGERVTEIKDRLATTRRRLDEIRFEAGLENSDRISIVTAGLPGAPAVDRRAGVTAAGALFGLVGGAAIVFLLGIRDPRIRFVENLEALELATPVIGLLPDAGREAHLAAAGTRQLRNLVELMRGNPRRNVLAVTSAGRGEGRTRTAMDLAESFARAGRRTLLIDADFTRPRISADLEMAGGPGLRDAIMRGAAEDTLRPTRRPDLLVMPIGQGSIDPRRLTPAAVSKLLDDLRGRFDAVIIDTGPILTEFEACLLAAASDQVVLLVDRHQRAPLVRMSLAQLSHLKVECTGIVFNRAATADVKARQAAGMEHASLVGGDSHDPPPGLAGTDPAGRIQSPVGRKRAA